MTTLLASKGFLQESQEFGCILLLIPVVNMAASNVPAMVEGLMQQYVDVFPLDLPPDLPPMRDIKHCIDLVRCSPSKQTGLSDVSKREGRYTKANGGPS